MFSLLRYVVHWIHPYGKKLAKYEDIALLNVQTKHVFKILLKFCDVLTYFCTYVIPIL